MTKLLLSWPPPLRRKIFFHDSSSVPKNTSYSSLRRCFYGSLTHYHWILVCWNASSHSQEQILGAAKKPDVYPPSQAIEHTHGLLMRARSVFAVPGCSCILWWCRLLCYFFCSFAGFSSLGFAYQFPGTTTGFHISTEPRTGFPKLLWRGLWGVSHNAGYKLHKLEKGL